MKKIVLLFLFLVVISSCVYQQREDLTPVKVRLKWLHQAQFAGMYVAKEKGFYEKYGLNVSLKRGGVDFPAIPDVISHKADFGVAGADDIIISVSEGHPVKAVAVIYKRSPVVYFALNESGIKTPYDFIGKKVGMKQGTGTSYSYYTMLSVLGINNSLIEEVNVSHDLTPFYNKEVDVWPGFRINEPRLAEEQGYNLNMIYPEDWGVVMYADVLITTQDMINNNPDIVRSFVKATLEGWRYAIEHEEEALNVTMKYAEESSRDHQEYMLRKSIPLIHTGDSELGLMDGTIWQDMITVLAENSLLKTKLNTTQLYTNEFIN